MIPFAAESEEAERMARMKVRTIVGIVLSSLYLILVTWLVFSAFDCPVVTVLSGAGGVLLRAAVDIPT